MYWKMRIPITIIEEYEEFMKKNDDFSPLKPENLELVNIIHRLKSDRTIRRNLRKIKKLVCVNE